MDYYAVGETESTRGGESGESPLVYIFNFEDNAGYAIASGDSRTSAPVFAIIDCGCLNPEEGIEIPAMAAFLANMEEIQGRNPKKAGTRDSCFRMVRILPLGSARLLWIREPCGLGTTRSLQQLAPYVSGTATRAAAGCTATALAQTLAFPALRPVSYIGIRLLLEANVQAYEYGKRQSAT